MLRTIFMTARALCVPEICIGQTDSNIIIRYEDKLNSEVLCSLSLEVVHPRCV